MMATGMQYRQREKVYILSIGRFLVADASLRVRDGDTQGQPQVLLAMDMLNCGRSGCHFPGDFGPERGELSGGE